MEHFLGTIMYALFSLLFIGVGVSFGNRARDLMGFCTATLLVAGIGVAGVTVAVFKMFGQMNTLVDLQQAAALGGLLTVWFSLEVWIRKQKYDAEWRKWLTANNAVRFGGCAYVINEYEHDGRKGAVIAWHRGPKKFVPNVVYRDGGFYHRADGRPDFKTTRYYSHYANEQTPLFPFSESDSRL